MINSLVLRNTTLLVIFMVLIGGSLIPGQWAAYAGTTQTAGTVSELINAINNANSEVGLYVGADTIILTDNIELTVIDNATGGANGLPTITSEITIDGQDLYTIQRGDGTWTCPGDTGQPDFRIVYVAANGTLALTNVTLNYGCTAGQGGAIYIINGATTLDNVTLSFNTGYDGAALFSNNGLLTIDASRITDNRATDDAGGIFINGGTVLIENTSISDNVGRDAGGAMRNDYGDVVLDNVRISGNRCNYAAGIVNNHPTATLTIRDSTIIDNQAIYVGGGIYNVFGHMEVFRGNISGNSSDMGGGFASNNGEVLVEQTIVSGNQAQYGAGILNWNATLTLQDTVVEDNNASNDGGGLYNHFGLINIESNTSVCDNYAADTGGGIFDDSGDITLDNTTVCRNEAINGGGIATTADDDQADGLTIQNASIIGGPASTDGNWAEVGGGILNRGSRVTITDSAIVNNAGGIVHDSGTTAVSDSCIVGNNLGFENLAAADQTAIDNWWGAIDGPSGAGPGSGDGVTALVAYDPWLIARPNLVSCPPSISVRLVTDMVLENAGTINVLELIRDTTTGISQVQVSITGGSAAAGEDFNGSPFPLSVTFQDGTDRVLIPLSITDNTMPEFSETVEFQIISLSNAAIMPPQSVTFTILDDDSPPDPVISKVGELGPGQLGLPGDQITWTVTVTNEGGAPATNVVISDTVPATLHIASVTAERGTVSISGSVVMVNMGTLNPGEMVRIEIVTTIRSSPAAGLFTNVANLTADHGLTRSASASVSGVTGLPGTGYPPG